MGDVQLLLAEREVKNVVLRYCRGVDRMDLALVRSCYHLSLIHILNPHDAEPE